MRIDSSGNVGIGTTNPGAKLEISHSGTNNGLLLENTLNSSNYQIALNIRENEGLIFQRWIAGAFNGNLMRIGYTGAIKFDAYDSTNQTGTPTYLLGTDGSGNVVKTLSTPGGDPGPYLPLAGGTMTGDINFNDNVYARFGNQPDFEIGHDTNNSYINHTGVGNLIIQNTEDNADIIFKSDNGSGGVENYIQIDGSEGRTTFNKNIRLNDNVQAQFGSSADLQIYHDGTGSYIEQKTGHMYIMQRANDKGLYFQADNGSGGDATYFTVDGANEVTSFQKDSKHEDNIKAYFGNASDLSIYHNSSNDRGYIYNATGDLYIENDATDGNIKFFSDNGSGGTTAYFQVDGANHRVKFSKNSVHTDNVKALFGDSLDLQIYHDGSNSYINDTDTGDLYIQASDNMYFQTYGSGKRWITLNENASVDLFYNDSKKFETTNTGVTVTGAVTATTFLGDLNGTINTATTAVTKANATNDTTVATTAFVQNLIGTIPAGLVFQGTWNASTNTPTLTSGSGTTGHFYIVSTDGSTNLDGITDWKVGDWAVFVEQGASDQWEKVDNSSVLDGSGTGEALPLWSGSGTSNTLTNSHITQSTSLANDIIIPQYIRHTGDTNTFFGFSQPDNFIINTNNASALTINSAQNATFAGTVNVDSDFKVRGSSGEDHFVIAPQAAGTGTYLISYNGAETGYEPLRIDAESYNFTNAGTSVISTSGLNTTFAGDVLLSSSKVLYTNAVQAVSSAGLKLGNDNNSGYVFIKDSGEVNIGTESPSYNTNYGTGDLNVENDIFASAQIFTHNDTAGNFSFLGLGKSSGTGASPTVVQANERIAVLGFYGYDGAAYKRLASIDAYVDGTPGTNDMPGKLLFNTTSDGSSSPTTRLTIGADGNATFTGSISSGAITSTSAVTGTRLVANGTGNAIELNQSSTGSATYYVMDNTVETGGKRYRFGYSGGSSDKGSFSIYNQTDSIMPLLLSGANATFAGDVLVEDNLYLTDAGTVRGKIQLNASDRDDLDIKAVSLGSNMKFFTVDTERMRINASGNVGIGDPSPTSISANTFSLSVNSSRNDLSGALISKANGTVKHQQYWDSSGYSFNLSAGAFQFNGGNVGIGTTSPSYKLDVNGGIQAGGLVTYSKVAGSLNTTGYAVAGLIAGFNGASAGFEFKCYGGNSKYQRVVYSCHCSGTTWVPGKVIDEGTNDLDVVASANGATITFTFKARSSTQHFSPRIVVQATGHSINSTYA
jgi:hypothetical protein